MAPASLLDLVSALPTSEGWGRQAGPHGRLDRGQGP
ncbi:predicted protein [Plenodomus lingam JN3]|uniref:Predicted protein n=1 Tax=Leptosphaeria maculans (strain JN3 / isolate v23.1.3 / race Av1-4-5-6-7-8) TaxID=985895 RepID=E4ZX40_LEPMJ|nr:predicted protein [Plenodomus lingam JN3]CBX95250.1 predicted protein [Plenodomus lingam JN3]